MPRHDWHRLLWAAPLLGLACTPGHALADPGAAAPSLSGLFKTAPEQPPDGALVLEVTLNGVPMGPMVFVASGGTLAMSPETVRGLRLASSANGIPGATPLAPAAYELDRPGGTVAITMPVEAFEPLTLTPFGAPTVQKLSPEAVGLYLSYDLNARHDQSPQSTQAAATSHDGYGGFANLHGFAPDLAATSSWSYDSQGTGGPVRLDTTLTWRPADRYFALSIGDLVSAPGTVARPFRFTGLAFGTDHSAEPGWSPVPLPSVTGTAQPTSSIDLYVNGLRTAQRLTPGGPFTMILPQGSSVGNAHLVVTDISGRVIDIPISTPRFSLGLVRRGLSLWSIGVGAPRFNWGAESATWLTQAFGYGSWQLGLRDAATAAVHGEAGAGFWQAEAELRALVSNAIGLRAAASTSHSEFGSGHYFSASAILSLPARISVDVSGGVAAGTFNDAVSVSGVRFDQRHALTNAYSEPLQQSAGLRVSWQPLQRLALSGEYHRLWYRGSRATPYASLTATTSLGGSSALFVTASRDYSGSSGTSVVAGLSLQFGRRTNGSVSAGRENGAHSAQVSLARPLGQEQGDVGWQLAAQNGGFGYYLNSEAQFRSGHGIPAVGLTRFGGTTQAHLSTAGSVGVVAGHPFAGDPINGGVIIADVGQQGVPLAINGYDVTRSGRDGKALIPVSVAGAPQRLEVALDHVSLDLIPVTTTRIVTVRQGSGTVAAFAVQSAGQGAVVVLRVDGLSPPAGTSVLLGGMEIPVDLGGRAWLPQIDRDATLDVELPDGRRCAIATRFDGHGGPGVVLGPYECRPGQ